MATKSNPSPAPMGTAQGDPGEVGTLPGPNAGIRNTVSTTHQVKPWKGHNNKAVIIDLGSQYCKCGYGGEPRPTYFISSTVGKRSPEVTADAGDTRKETYVGHELLNIEAPLKLVNPLKHGVVVDWDCVQSIWEYIFHTAMKICPEEHPVLVSDSPLSSSSSREKYAELLFETFSIPAMHVTSQALLSIYSYGRTTGLVVESGHSVSHVVPISQGDILPGLASRADYAGSDLTNYLMQMLNEAGHRFTDDHLHIIEHIKKKCCYAALLPEEEQLGLEELRLDYELPDGKVITISKERFRCAEMLFKPSLVGCPQLGLPAFTAACLDRCEEAGFKEEMATNVLLCGGCTTLDGFPERFQRELSLLCPEDSPIVAAGPERKTSVWTGGSILASLEAFQQLWVSKEEFEERGGAAIYTKC
ncbi:PREDICTED: actin-like protein 7B [Chinchilla lanigera]|uniref:Actin like 7B n=1 Tax=Chinchilla lanigera TaxID=34839 RepID=A0A8C2W637_CHILA|nr:PREDICTED: actin-like protein 7B [Chinchilla lanigera]